MLQHVSVPPAFLCLSNFTLCGHNHISFIHSLVDGHLGCFDLWAIINSTDVNVQHRILLESQFKIIWGMSRWPLYSSWYFLSNVDCAVCKALKNTSKQVFYWPPGGAYTQQKASLARFSGLMRSSLCFQPEVAAFSFGQSAGLKGETAALHPILL